jgi:hypothetical protein
MCRSGCPGKTGSMSAIAHTLPCAGLMSSQILIGIGANHGKHWTRGEEPVVVLEGDVLLAVDLVGQATGVVGEEVVADERILTILRTH